MYKFKNVIYMFLTVSTIVGASLSTYSQVLGVFNEKQKKIYKYKSGREIDFRIDYKKLYPEKNDSIVESRVYALIDSIIGEKIFLSETFLVTNYTKNKDFLIEMPYEYTDHVINIGDIKAVSFRPTLASIGNAFLVLGIATILASPLLGITPGGFSTDRFAKAAAFGAGSAIIGGTFLLSFGQKPVKFKDFEGPDYFKKYQRGSLSTL